MREEGLTGRASGASAGRDKAGQAPPQPSATRPCLPRRGNQGWPSRWGTGLLGGKEGTRAQGQVQITAA